MNAGDLKIAITLTTVRVIHKNTLDTLESIEANEIDHQSGNNVPHITLMVHNSVRVVVLGNGRVLQGNNFRMPDSREIEFWPIQLTPIE